MADEMTFAQACDVADRVSPLPVDAHRALQVFRRRLIALTTLANEVRTATGVACTWAQLPDVVAQMRAKLEGRS